MKLRGMPTVAVAAMCFGVQNVSAIEAPNFKGDINVNLQVGTKVMPSDLDDSETDNGLGVSLSGDYVLRTLGMGHLTVGCFFEINSYTETSNLDNAFYGF